MRQHTKMRTLNVAICRLRRKGAMPATSCRCTVHGIGYVFLGKLREFAEPLTGQRARGSRPAPHFKASA